MNLAQITPVILVLVCVFLPQLLDIYLNGSGIAEQEEYDGR